MLFLNGNQRRGTRGQLYSTDALLSLVIFSFCLVMVASITNQLAAQSAAAGQEEYLSLQAQRVMGTLLSTSGDPAYWESLPDKNSVQIVGLVSQGVEITPSKWTAFQDWNATDYPTLTEAMGLGNQDFYLTITDLNREIIGRAGISPVDSNRVALVSAAAIFDQVPVWVHLQLYEGG